MDIRTFLRSVYSLRNYFGEIAHAGYRGEAFPMLRRLGVRAEEQMLSATRGVNTHRGAIFSLGLLAAAAGRCLARGRLWDRLDLGEVVSREWGDALGGAVPAALTHGSDVAARYGAGGARMEAARGFPTLFQVGLPALEEAIRAGSDPRAARVQALFSMMAVLEDTNLLHRGGEPGLGIARERARGFLGGGGVFRPDWETRAVAIHREFVHRNLSPGGSADLLSATCFVHALTGGVD
jgi:triphosphoribosyl-dephospho-CoA synthase